MSDLVEFLRARLSEDEQAARAAIDGRLYMVEVKPLSGVHQPGLFEAVEKHFNRWGTVRVLADCDAKRRIIDLLELEILDDAEDQTAQAMLKTLALPHADHVDFREEWKP